MHTLKVSLGSRTYPIYIGKDLLTQSGLITQHLPQKRAAVVTDSNVAPLYLEKLTATLTASGITVTPIIIPAGEQHKDWQSLNSIFDALLTARCERKTALHLVAVSSATSPDLRRRLICAASLSSKYQLPCWHLSTLQWVAKPQSITHRVKT